MTPSRTSRRGFLGALAVAATARPGHAAPAADPLTLTVRETAGLRRFGYPVHVDLPNGLAGPFRLERDGKPVAAQFTELRAVGGTESVALDFNASPGPLEVETYLLHHGPGTEPVARPRGGIVADRVGDDYRVVSGGSLRYEVPAHLSALVRSVTNGRHEFIAAKQASPGLWVEPASTPGRRFVFGGEGIETSIVQNGPFAVVLRLTGPVALPGNPRIVGTVECRFPSSKSWVETTWTLDDPEGHIAALGAGFGLQVAGEPTLVDMGANDTVYATIKGREHMQLEGGTLPGDGLPPARPPWLIRKGEEGKGLSLFASAASGGSAQGWAHVMDPTRCTAVALADFGKGHLDRLDVEASGRVELERRYTAGGEPPGAKTRRATKSLRFWAHFVPMPVQVGALTSPQAMLAPLVAEWGPRRA